VNPLHEQAHVLGHARIEGNEVAPLAARAGHLPEHLCDILAGHGLTDESVDVGCRVGALDLDQPIITDQAVRACSSHGDRRMRNEPDLHDLGIHSEFVSNPGVGLVLRSPLHGGIRELLGGLAGQAFRNQFGHVVRAGCAPAGLGTSNHVSHAGRRDLADPDGQPFLRALNDLGHHLTLFALRASTARWY